MAIIVSCSAAIDVRPTPACEGHGESDLVHYVIVRADLPHGSQVAQAIHAAGESARERVPPRTVAVALAARDQEQLLAIDAALDRAGIAHTLIRECDGEPMSIGVEPTKDRRAVKRVLSSVPLVR